MKSRNGVLNVFPSVKASGEHVYAGMDEGLNVWGFINLLTGEVEASGEGGRRVRRFLDRLASQTRGEAKVKDFIAKLVNKAKRNGAWRRFSGKDFLTLCLSLPVKFRSPTFIKALLGVLKELLLLLNPIYKWFIAGYEVAWKICETAQKWGNKNALEWMRDKNFIIYWGMITTSNPFNIA
jgi:hypothetical protein